MTKLRLRGFPMVVAGQITDVQQPRLGQQALDMVLPF